MNNPDPRGQLFLYDYATTGSIRQIELVGFPQASDFHPLGVNFFRKAGDGRTRLFVVNHGRQGCTVEIMDVDYSKLRATYIRTLADGDMTIRTPNAVAPISYTQFYVTNDHRYTLKQNPTLAHLETWLSLGTGWVTLVDFSTADTTIYEIVASGIPLANGLTLTTTNKELLVASSSTNCVHIYDRDTKTNALSKSFNKVHVTFPPDNLRFDSSLSIDDPTAFDKSGRFLRGATAAGCPNPIKLFKMSRNPVGIKAPSMMVELHRGSEKDAAPYAACQPGSESKYYARLCYQSLSFLIRQSQS